MNFTTISLRSRGFTIVELLIVVVVIGVLAAIVVIAYNGATTRAQNSKIDSDLSQLKKAIFMAQAITSQPLPIITGNGYTASWCIGKPTGTDLAALDHNTDQCWIDYKATLAAIGTAAKINVPLLTDPWGRPYMIDENEGEFPATPCRHDDLAEYPYPFVSGGTARDIYLPFTLPGC